MAEKNVDLDQSRALYNGGRREYVCVCFKGKWEVGVRERFIHS